MAWFSRNETPTLNCHFCNKNTTTPKIYKQGWICPDPYCSQYNGFNPNGDYNLNIINEFSQPSNTSKQTTYCKPSNIPFKTVNNVFQSNIHFTPDTYIPSTSSAPLCNKCQQNQNTIQSNLRNFDAGANSNYKAYAQYRQLLEDKYPICSYCKSQCAYQLNTINHNARLWQKYEDTLPHPTNINTFKMEHKVKNTNNYCCSSFIRCIINSLLLYLSFFISIIGLSNYCQSNLKTSPHIIQKCDIKLFLLKCENVKQKYYSPCLYIHALKYEMEKYFLVSHYTILCSILLLFTFISYNSKKHNYKWFILLILSCTLLILIPVIDNSFLNIPFSNAITYTLQISMFIFCLLFLICTTSCNSNRNNNKKPKINPFTKPMDSNELLHLLEEQEIKENVNENPFNIARSKSISTSIEQKQDEHTPFFPSFGMNNKNKNKMSEWKNVNDPFQKHNDKYSYSTEPINPFYGTFVNNKNNVKSNIGLAHEPMDICDTPNRSPMRNQRGLNRNINSVSNGIHTLDLNGTF